MALIDMLTDITSFNYEKVGQKQGEYFGEDKATGFTPNRAVGDATEYQSSVFPPLGTTNFISPENPLENLESIHIMNPNGTDYFQPDYNPLSAAESIHIYNPDGTNYFTPDYNPLLDTNFEYPINTNYFTPNYNPLEGESIFESSFVDYFDNTHQTGFSTPEFKVSNFVNQDGFSPTAVNYFDDIHQTGLHLHPEHKVSNFVNQDGFTPTAVNYFDDTHQTGLHLYPEHKVSYFVNQDGFTPTFVDYFDNTHQTGFSTPILKESNFVNQDGFTPTAVNFFGDVNHPGFNLNISHGEDAESHYIIGSGNDFNFVEGSVVDYLHNNNATGYTLNRTQNDLGPGPGAPGFHTIEDGGTAGEYIVGSSLYDDIGLTNFFDIDKVFTTGLFVKEMTTLESDFNASVNDTFQFNMSGLTSLDYTRINSAIGEGGSETTINIDTSGISITTSPDYGRRGQGTNLPKTSDFRGGINSPDGEGGKYHNELRISAYKDQWKKFGGNAKGLRGANNLGFDEPFIIKEIGEDSSLIGFGMVDGLTDIPFMAVRAIEDIIRITKWTLTPKGIVWNLKQALLQSLNPRKETRIFNPLGTLAAVPPLLHTPRHTGGTFIDFKDPPSYPDDTEISGFFGLGKTGDDEGPVGDQTPMANAGADKPATEKTTGGFLGFGATTEYGKTDKDASDYNLGSGKVKVGIDDKLYMVGVSNQLQVPYGGHEVDTTTSNLPKDFIKFRIRDLINGKWLIFPAHLGTITDTVTPSWSPEKYIGRPDSVHLYSGTDRSVSFDFKVAAFTKQEIPVIQEKMNYLMGLGYPTFKAVMEGDDESRPVAPFIALTIGDLFNNTPGYFSGITITMEENSTWELDEGFQIPQFFSVSVEFVHVGKYLPQTLGKHYEVPWLTDYGIASEIYPEARGTFQNVDLYSRPEGFETMAAGGAKAKHVVHKITTDAYGKVGQ